MIKTVDFFGNQITRMTIGDNPFHGNTYIHDIYTWHDMMDYYTADKCVQALFEAEENGINTFIALASPFTLRVIHQYQNEGGKMHIMFQTYPAMDLEININQLMYYKPIAIYHQGSTFDDMYETGQIDLLHKRLKLIRDTGVITGFATHLPEVVMRAEEEKWDVDFYKTCLYNTRRTQRGEKSGFITGKTKQLVMYHEDRLLMLNAIKKVSKPCIAFKIFAGGQVFINKSGDDIAAAAETAIKQTFENIKPNDFVCIGVFQRDKNQIKENCDITKKVLGE